MKNLSLNCPGTEGLNHDEMRTCNGGFVQYYMLAMLVAYYSGVALRGYQEDHAG